TADGDHLTAELTVVGPADGLLAVAFMRGDEEGLALVPAGAATVTALRGIDTSRPLTAVVLDGVSLDGAQVVTGPDLLAERQALVSMVAALDAVGAAREALDRTLAYCVARQQ